MLYAPTQTREYTEAFFALCEKSEHIVITAHYSPDDDSIASVLAMQVLLSRKYPKKDIRIVYTGTVPERFSVIPHFEKIAWVSDVADNLEGTDLLIILDVNRYSRISHNPEKIIELGISTAVIDHHKSPPDEFTIAIILSDISSNAESIYRLFDAKQLLTPDLAELFLLGILGDTGNFAYVAASQTEVFAVAGELVKVVGMSIDQFRGRYGGIPKRIVPLLQLLVSNTTYTEVEGWPSIQYTWIDRASTQGYTDEDMSAASHIYMGQYLTRIQGQPWGIVATPRTDGGCRVSARSQPGSVNVRDMFERMGIGGGHDRASGSNIPPSEGFVDGQEGIAKVLDWMKENTPLIG